MVVDSAINLRGRVSSSNSGMSQKSVIQVQKNSTTYNISAIQVRYNGGISWLGLSSIQYNQQIFLPKIFETGCFFL